MFSVIIASHGSFAHASLESAELIIGKQDYVKTIGVTIDKNVDDVYDEFVDAIQKLPGEILILTDIKGGTPFNVAFRLKSGCPDLKIIYGFNMPLLLEILSNRDISLDELEQYINKIKDESCDFLHIDGHLDNSAETDQLNL